MPNERPFTPAPKPSQAKAASKPAAKKPSTPAKPAAAKKPAAKKAPAGPKLRAAAKKKTSKKPATNKPNTGLMCRTCGTRDIVVSSQLVRRIREGKRVVMANCRCKNGHEFQSKHPEAVKASREADKQKVATVTVIDGSVVPPLDGWDAQRAREKKATNARVAGVAGDIGTALDESFASNTTAVDDDEDDGYGLTDLADDEDDGAIDDEDDADDPETST